MICFQTPCYDEKLSYEEMCQKKSRFKNLLVKDQHIYLYSRDSITAILQNHGFKHIIFEPAFFGDDYDTKDGTCIRDYIHVDDISSAHLAALKYLKDNDSDVFNVGYGHGFSVKEVIEAMKKVSGVDFKVELAPRRAGDPSVLISNADKIRAKTSWRAKYDDLELICKSAYEWEKLC